MSGGDGKETRSGLAPKRVFATALAALTGAFLASQLGLYGTVVGAGVFSFMTTVGTELYLRSLDRTKVAAQRTRDVARARTSRLAPASGATGARPPTEKLPVTESPTQRLPVGELPSSGPVHAQVGPDDGPDTELERRKRIRWPLVAGLTAAAFAVAILAVTGIEALTGKSLSGDDHRTTVSGVVGGNKGAEQQREPEDDDQQAPATTAVTPEQTPETTPTEPEPVEVTPTEDAGDGDETPVQEEPDETGEDDEDGSPVEDGPVPGPPPAPTA